MHDSLNSGPGELE